MMRLCGISLFLLVALNSSHAAILNTNPLNGSALYKCTGSDVILPLSNSLSPDDVVEVMKWYFNGQLVATNRSKMLLTTDKFIGRIELVSNENHEISQLMIKKVTNKDTGVYTIKVNGRSSNQSTFTLERSLTLEVTDGLWTSDQHLHLTQKPSLVWNKANNSWSAELLCGKFQYNQTPPFDVQWLTPSRQVKASTGYQDGFFYQHLPSPLEGGEYTCKLSKQTPDACLSEDVEATLLVDARDANMSRIEAKLASCQEQNQGMNQQLQDQLNQMNQQLKDQTKNIDKQLQDLTKNMNQQLQDQTKNVNQQLQDQTKNMNQQLQDQMKTQKNQNAESMKTIQQKFAERNTTLAVSFLAGKLRPYSLKQGEHMVLTRVYTNQGNGYSNTTGVFTAPVSGTYCFMATTGPSSDSDDWAGVNIMRGQSVVASVGARGDGQFGEFATAHAVIHLDVGQTVWLKASHKTFYWELSSRFSGFLLS